MQGTTLLWTLASIAVAALAAIVAFSPNKLIGPMQAHIPLAISLLFAVAGGVATYRLIPAFHELFIKAGLWGKDMSKVGDAKVPKNMGTVSSAVYLIIIFLSIPIPFVEFLYQNVSAFPHDKLSKFLSALLSICCMIFLGFADDVLDLRWRDKLFLPTVASLPLLMVYHVDNGVTDVMVPQFLQPWLGSVIDLGIFYYIYMGMLAVFCTNAINIYAGINGVEAGQSLVIALSLALNNVVQLYGDGWEAHLFSLLLLLPFIGTTFGLYLHNMYPSKVFVGDTFCYFAGMTFACVGILGHFSKTMLLFFIPQIFNFGFSIPQLFKWVPCPRHRLPKFNHQTGLLGMSYAPLRDATPFGKFIVRVLSALGFVHVRTVPSTSVSASAAASASTSTSASASASTLTADSADNSQASNKQSQPESEVSNFTLLNYLLLVGGPMREDTLTAVALLVQVACSAVAFFLRYYVFEVPPPATI